MKPKKLKKSQVVPRKKPARETSKELVENLIEAAALVLESRGLEGYTTNHVAARAGVSIGSLYQYFPSKEALTAALIKRETDIVIEAVRAIPEDIEWTEALDSFIHSTISHQMERPELARLLDFEEARLPIAKQNQEFERSLECRLEKILQKSDLEFIDTLESLTDDVFVLMKGLTDRAGERGQTDRKRLFAKVQRAVLGYLDRCQRK